jgi:hypothetical protein
MKLQNLDGQGGNVQINGALNSNHNDYSMIMTATVDYLTITTNFIVTIRDPCSTAVFQNIPNLFTDIFVSMPSFAA